MAYTIEFLPTAVRALAALPKAIQKRIARRIDALAHNPRPPGVKVLRGGEGFLRLRVGDYRVIYRIEERRLVILVVKIGHRREVYRQR